jgi:hypothetical protein
MVSRLGSVRLQVGAMVITGAWFTACCTVKAFANDTISPPVVTVRVRLPVAALRTIEIFAVNAVELVTDTLFTVTPAPPKLTVVVPCAKCVNWPVMLTDKFWRPCGLLFGLTSVMTGVPFVMVKPLLAVTTSDPVVRVTSRAPAAATVSMLTKAVALVAEFTMSDATVMLAPKFAVVVP